MADHSMDRGVGGTDHNQSDGRAYAVPSDVGTRRNAVSAAYLSGCAPTPACQAARPVLHFL